MKKLWIGIGGAALGAVLVLGQSSPLVDTYERNIRSHAGDGKRMFYGGSPGSLLREERLFYLNGVQYAARMSEATLFTGPDWNPLKPLPLDFAAVEGIARKELRKFIQDDSDWEVRGFHLRSARFDALGGAQNWFFQVEMQPLLKKLPKGAGEHPPDSFWVFIGLTGEAGKIELYNGL